MKGWQDGSECNKNKIHRQSFRGSIKGLGQWLNWKPLHPRFADVHRSRDRFFSSLPDLTWPDVDTVFVGKEFEWNYWCTHWQRLPSSIDSQICPWFHHDLGWCHQSLWFWRLSWTRMQRIHQKDRWQRRRQIMLVNATQTDRDQWFEGGQTAKELRVRFTRTRTRIRTRIKLTIRQTKAIAFGNSYVVSWNMGPGSHSNDVSPISSSYLIGHTKFLYWHRKWEIWEDGRVSDHNRQK